MSKKGSEKVIEVLNKARADELAAILQYMGHHYEAGGVESPAIIELFKKSAIDEMKHAEKLAERIAYLGGEPVQKASPTIKRGGDLKKMVQDDLDTEYIAIKNYKEWIKVCESADDPVTRRMLEEILADEEGHADNWETILNKK